MASSRTVARNCLPASTMPAAPAQRHLPVAPAFDVAAVHTTDADHAFDGVARRVRARGRGNAQAQPVSVSPPALAQAGPRAGMSLVQLGPARAQLGLNAAEGTSA